MPLCSALLQGASWTGRRICRLGLLRSSRTPAYVVRGKIKVLYEDEDVSDSEGF